MIYIKAIYYKSLESVGKTKYKFADIIVIITLYCDVYTHISLIVPAVYYHLQMVS